MLGIEQPIVQASMADVSRLAAAVSNAGALGRVTLTGPLTSEPSFVRRRR
jgi:NAD(P)H-dependent flavin oxidoreductase YrpB (nitropropane dioxygenase family)